MKPLQVKLGDEEWLGKESCEGGEGCQLFCTCKRMLVIPGTRQMIIKQALNQMGIKKISLLF